MEENKMAENKGLWDKLSLPVSIIIAGALIAVGIYMNGRIAVTNPTQQQAQQQASQDLSKSIKPIDDSDHILGSPDAKVLVIEYSDTECPYCKQFHSTMHQVMQGYGSSGNVAWIYRHYPIAELHSKAAKEAEATECAASLGGNSKFWEYIDKVFEVTTSNNSLDSKELYNIASQVGLPTKEFTACLDGGQFSAKINTDIQDAQKAGIAGTPFSVVVDVKNNKYYPVEGAYPYSGVKQVIDMILGG